MSQIQRYNLARIFFVILTAFLLYGFFGCDTTKKQTYHYKKFIHYGGKVDCKGDTLWKYDTTYLDGKEIIDSFPIPCNCPDPQIGYTNKQMRMLLRHQKDSMVYLLKLEKIRAQKLEDSLRGALLIEKQKTKQGKTDVKLEKEETKQAKETTKQEGKEQNGLWLWLAMALIALIAIYLIKKQ